MRLLTAALTASLAFAFATQTALSENSRPSSRAGKESGNGKSGAGNTNPVPSSVGGAISGQEDASKGATAGKGNTATGLHPGR